MMIIDNKIVIASVLFANFASMKTAIPFLLFLIMSFFGEECYGQLFYVSPGIGGGLNLSINGIDGKNDDPNANFTPGTPNDHSNSPGGGSNLFFTIGYCLGKQTNFEITVSSINTFAGLYVSNYSPHDPESFDTISAKRIRIIPTLKLTGDTSKSNLYFKLGGIIGVGGIINRNYGYGIPIYNHGDFYETYSTAIQYTGNASLGLMTALGCDLKIIKRLSFFIELSLTLESWMPGKAQITNNTYTFESYQQPYVSTTTPININPYLPSFNKTYILTSLGLNFGLNYKFGKIKTESK
jgi:hypothetical protein